MEIKKMLKPNSHKCLRRRDEFSYWSTLPLDLLIDVFNHLGFADFQRAKSVCSSWHSASKHSLPNNQIPWLILFPKEDRKDNNKNSCTLFNPEESKFYKTQDIGVGFTKNVCLATCGSWLFMRDHSYNLFILNLLTKERINLPQVESLVGNVKIRGSLNAVFSILFAVLWIDETTKDYVVLWTFQTQYVVYYKKGDQFWNLIHGISYCIDMVYQDHKLYTFSITDILRILDFSGEVPQQIYECTAIVSKPYGFHHASDIFETRLVVTSTGDVLSVNKVLDCIHRPYRPWSFYVYKIYSSSGGLMKKKPEQVVSLGDEAIVFDLGITVFAHNSGGFRRNSIYFSPKYKTSDAFRFDMETKKMEKLDKFDCSRARLSNARWFLPNFKQT